MVVNVGSSTVKLDVVAIGGGRVEGEASEGVRIVGEALDAPLEPDALERFLDRAPGIDVVGHRVVHGGPQQSGPAMITDDLLGDLDEVSVLAPLHNPPALQAIEVVRRLRPGLPAVACFDTTFHTTIPREAATYAVPAEWRDRWGLRVYGFHGLSHAYATRRAARMVGRRVEDLRVVTCHLGAGASLAAVRGGRSVATTMGFTPLSGLVMATRSGDVDPGALMWLQQQAGLGADEMTDLLLHRSGLAGLSGTSGDMREVLAGIADGDEACLLAWKVYNHRLRLGISAMVGTMSGLDVLVFTGGVAERAGSVRLSTCAWGAFLGLGIDDEANAAHAPDTDADLSEDGATVRTLVVHAREDLEVARQVSELLAG
nr:acetate/propionate family kinase [Rhabdothermincola salaria]